MVEGQTRTGKGALLSPLCIHASFFMAIFLGNRKLCFFVRVETIQLPSAASKGPRLVPRCFRVSDLLFLFFLIIWDTHALCFIFDAEMDALFVFFFVLLPLLSCRRGRMLRLVAENAALEDALYYLDLGVTDSVISVEVFLKEIRRLARKQFVARATMKKVQKVSRDLKCAHRSVRPNSCILSGQPWASLPSVSTASAELHSAAFYIHVPFSTREDKVFPGGLLWSNTHSFVIILSDRRPAALYRCTEHNDRNPYRQ